MKQIRFFPSTQYFLLFITIQICLFHLASAKLTEDEFKMHQEAALKWHNIFRSWHNAPPMTLDAKLNKDAQEYAQKILDTGIPEHSKGIPETENIYRSSGRETKNGAEKATRAWYKEFCGMKKPYDKINHFTQLTWNESRQIGVGIAIDDGDMKWKTVVVVRYKPRGNNCIKEACLNKYVWPLDCEESQICDGKKLKEPFKEDRCVHGSGKGRASGGGGGAGKAFVISKERSVMFAVLAILIGLIQDRTAFAV